jgi:hypothetical protein
MLSVVVVIFFINWWGGEAETKFENRKTLRKLSGLFLTRFTPLFFLPQHH